MPRDKDIAWKFVFRPEEGGNKWRCPYCEAEYCGQVTRVKSHFLKIPNRGIAFCTKVPEHIIKLMQQLLDQVGNKDDMAWKFVDRLGDNKWRCHYCSEEFFGDLTGVKCHLLKVPNEGISICAAVPDPVRTLMRSLLDEVADEEESREANVQFFTEPQTRDMPTQAEVVAEEESREANIQISTGTPWTLPSPGFFSPDFIACVEQLIEETDIGLNSDQQSQAERQFHQSSTTPSLVQNSHGETISCSTMALAEVESYLLNSPNQPQCSIRYPYLEETLMNDQQTPAGASSFQHDELPAVGNSNCLQDCDQHSQLQTPMDIDPSIGSQHTSDSHIIEATIVDSQVRKAATIAIGPSSTQSLSRLIDTVAIVPLDP